MGEIFVEHIVKRKQGIKEVLLRIFAIVFTIVAFFVGCYYLHMLGITLTILIGYLAYLVFVYTSVEYEYSLLNGELSVVQIRGQRKRKIVNTFDIKGAQLIAPASSDQILNMEICGIYDYSGGYRSEALYSILLHDKAGIIQVLFEPNEKMIEAMYHICRNAKR